MAQDWMIDVLRDICEYARTNRLPGLAEVLDDAMIVAAAELRERGAADPRGQVDVRAAGRVCREAEEHHYT